jgi:hypothetical protein
MGELLQQYRRQPNRQSRPGAMRDDVVDHRQQWQIRFRRRFIEPRFAMGPGAMMKDVGEMAVKDDAEAAEGDGH